MMCRMSTVTATELLRFDTPRTPLRPHLPTADTLEDNREALLAELSFFGRARMERCCMSTSSRVAISVKPRRVLMR